ncbi:MAG TPA: glycoside hydrolase family 88 protein [Oceanipulchritudo sp.]|nr:glycoside hydrolase family 88 protein [Oceanipulchritudo sp.]
MNTLTNKRNNKLNRLILVGISVIFGGTLTSGAQDYLSDFPEGKTPGEIGARVVDNLLSRPYRLTKFLRNRGEGSIHYAEICTAYGALGFADLTNDNDLLLRLEKRYRPIVDEKDSDLIPQGFHGDFTVFALVPFELYRLRGDRRFLELGVKMVEEQWKDPNPEDGMTWQARWWIDDAYMISSVDSLATRVTGDQTWVRNAAFFLNAYMAKLQDPNGLLPHTKSVPFYWGRGVGWVAAGLVECLVTLPEDHPLRPGLMQDYKELMAGLLPLQAPSGLWHQLLDYPDSYEETSCTGMFTYAYITGIKNGWLDAATYGPAARKGWLAMTDKINDKGEIEDVCVGTNEMEGAEAYLQRQRRTGDFHGQAPVLWCANALLR